MTSGRATRSPITTRRGITQAERREQREFRPIPGLEKDFGITRDAKIRDLRSHRVYDINDWPYAYFVTEAGVLRINVVDSTAAAWLDPAARETIRSKLPRSIGRSYGPMNQITRQLQVSRHAIVRIANCADEELTPFSLSVMPLPPERSRLPVSTIARCDHQRFKFLRPPLRDLHTSGISIHQLWIGEIRYSWLAEGTSHWFEPGQRIAFDYAPDPAGDLALIPSTISLFDAEGAPLDFVDPTRRTPAALAGQAADK